MIAGGRRRHDRDQTTRPSPTSTPTGRTVGSRSCPATTCRRSTTQSRSTVTPSPAAAANTLPALGALNTVLKIELDGTNAPGIGLDLGIGNESIDASNSRIDGLAINRFGGDGIRPYTLDGGVTIAGNFIGTDVSGLIDLGNGGNGVLLNDETDDTIGGEDAGSRDLISGNGGPRDLRGRAA